jgi:hypothetical protein
LEKRAVKKNRAPGRPHRWSAIKNGKSDVLPMNEAISYDLTRKTDLVTEYP